MGRRVTLPQFIDACCKKHERYMKGFRVLQWRVYPMGYYYPHLLELETPRYNKNFDTQFEQIHKDYAAYKNREYPGYTKCHDTLKAAIRKNQKFFEVKENKNKKLVFQIRTEEEIKKYEKAMKDEKKRNKEKEKNAPSITDAEVVINKNCASLMCEPSPGSSGYESASPLSSPVACPGTPQKTAYVTIVSSPGFSGFGGVSPQYVVCRGMPEIPIEAVEMTQNDEPVSVEPSRIEEMQTTDDDAEAINNDSLLMSSLEPFESESSVSEAVEMSKISEPVKEDAGMEIQKSYAYNHVQNPMWGSVNLQDDSNSLLEYKRNLDEATDDHSMMDFESPIENFEPSIPFLIGLITHL